MCLQQQQLPYVWSVGKGEHKDTVHEANTEGVFRHIPNAKAVGRTLNGFDVICGLVVRQL